MLVLLWLLTHGTISPNTQSRIHRHPQYHTQILVQCLDRHRVTSCYTKNSTTNSWKLSVIEKFMYVNKKIIQSSLVCPFSLKRKWSDLQLFPQSSTGKTCERVTRKAIFWWVTVEDKNVTNHIAWSNRTSVR